MQYRTYKFKELARPWYWNLPNKDGSYGEYVNKDTLVYASGGAVASYSVDNDYMVANNSTVNITQRTDAVSGQIIALIDGNNTFDIGVITRVDNENLRILYRSMMELFDTEILNPTRKGRDGDEVISYLYDGVNGTAQILASYFASANVDRYRRLPLFIRTSGGNIPAIWNYTDNTVNVRSWLLDLFDKHNIVLQFQLVFEAAYAYIEIYIQYNATGGRLLKGNIHGMTITHTEEGAAQATVCQVIDSETKELLSTWYLLSNNTVTQSSTATNRVQPYKLAVAEFDADNDDGATQKMAAEEELLYGDFNHYISVTINRDSGMFPENLTIGDAVTIVPEIDVNLMSDELSKDYDDRVFKSIYTGKKESSSSSEVTLIFGKIRINYTDIIQMHEMKKVRT